MLSIFATRLSDTNPCHATSNLVFRLENIVATFFFFFFNYSTDLNILRSHLEMLLVIFSFFQRKKNVVTCYLFHVYKTM